MAMILTRWKYEYYIVVSSEHVGYKFYLFIIINSYEYIKLRAKNTELDDFFLILFNITGVRTRRTGLVDGLM